MLARWLTAMPPRGLAVLMLLCNAASPSSGLQCNLERCECEGSHPNASYFTTALKATIGKDFQFSGACCVLPLTALEPP